MVATYRHDAHEMVDQPYNYVPEPPAGVSQNRTGHPARTEMRRR